MKLKKQYPKGNFWALGMIIGMTVGIAISLAIEGFKIGFALSPLFGIVLGYILESVFNPHPQEITDAKIKQRRKASWILVHMGLATFFVFAVTYFVMA